MLTTTCCKSDLSGDKQDTTRHLTVAVLAAVDKAVSNSDEADQKC